MKTMETDGLLALPISVTFLKPKEYNIIETLSIKSKKRSVHLKKGESKHAVLVS